MLYELVVSVFCYPIIYINNILSCFIALLCVSMFTLMFTVSLFIMSTECLDYVISTCLSVCPSVCLVVCEKIM